MRNQRGTNGQNRKKGQDGSVVNMIKTVYQFSVLADGISEEMHELNLLKDKMVVDKCLNNKIVSNECYTSLLD